MKHLTDEQLSARLDGGLGRRAAEEVERHLAACPPCREALAELAAQDESLKPALAHDPGEAYFESFASRVEWRVGAAGESRARPGGAPDPGRFFRSPRALAWAGGVAVVVVGGGLALMTTREVLPPDLRDRDVATRIERAAPGEAKQASPPVVMRSRDESQMPLATMEKEQIAPQAEKDGPFTPPPGDARTRSDAPAPAPPSASPVASAPANARLASPGRAREVRRTESGEEAPVRKEGEARTVAAPSPTPAARADQGGQVRKKLLAEPLEAVKKSAPKQTLGATGVRGEPAAPEYSFAPPPGDAGGIMAQRDAPGLDARGESRLCGEVRDAADRPIAGAHVVLADLGRTTTTDASGKFCMRVPMGEHPLSVMAVGYTESRQSVRAQGAESNLRVTLAAVSVLEGNRATISGRRLPPRTPVTTPTSPPGEPRDSYSALSDTLRRMVREAQRLDADAAARRSAAHFDMAAGAWQRALRRLVDGPLEIETRRHLAEARYRAWEIGPNSRRALAAVEALTSYVGRAPAGPERDQAAVRLNQLRP